MNMIGNNALAMLTQQAEEIAAKLSAVGDIDAGNCGQVKDLVSEAKKLAKDIDEARKLAKQPHMDAGVAVDSAFNPVRDFVNTAWAAPYERLNAWTVAEKKRADAEAEAARKYAEDLAAEQDAFLQDEDAVQEAITDAAVAQVRAKAASQVTSASGASRTSGLRAYRFADVKDSKAMVLHYHLHPDVLGAATKLANAAIRAAKGGPITIPGVEVKEEMRLA